VGFVFPIYSWGVPPIVLEWIAKIPAEELDGAYIYAVMTCGDEAGDALRMLLKAFRKRSVKLNASFTVVMPNNYVLLPGFSTDPLELEDDKLSRSLERIREIADTVKSGAEVCDVLRGKWPRLKTALVYPLFRRWGVQPSRWRVDAAKCISCGKCAAVCPVENIRLGVASASDEISENVSVVEERQEKAGKACPEKRAEGKRLPGWGRKCISCTACYHCCPVGAVSYGSFTGTKRRYTPKFPRLPLPEKIDANK
jgi:ferredoxin